MNWKRLTLALLLAGCSLASAAPVDDAVRMDQVVQHFVDTHQFMGAVLVARGDEVVFDKAYGHANLEWQIAAGGRAGHAKPAILRNHDASSLSGSPNTVLHVRHRSRSSTLGRGWVPGWAYVTSG